MNIIKCPLVSIQCAVYNHALYLRQCLDGFVMQKTNFAFEAIVHDDASTDGSAAIIREYAEKYPDIIKPIYETENQYSKQDGSLMRIMNAAICPDAKYITICEGDDYWIDPYKLQKQVDFLEANLDYGMVCTNHYEEINGILHKKPVRNINDYPRDGYLFDTLLKGNIISTLTICYRYDLYKKFQKHLETVGLDRCLNLCIASVSKIYFLDEITSVYRILAESASHSRSNVKLLKSYSEFTALTLKTLEYLGQNKEKINAFLIPRNRYLLFLANQANDKQLVLYYYNFLKENKALTFHDYLYYIEGRILVFKYLRNLFQFVVRFLKTN